MAKEEQKKIKLQFELIHCVASQCVDMLSIRHAEFLCSNRSCLFLCVGVQFTAIGQDEKHSISFAIIPTENRIISIAMIDSALKTLNNDWNGSRQ